MFRPYVYYIEDPVRSVRYIGCEYGYKSKIANPDNLWVTYFTSSRLVHAHIDLYGKNSFSIRKILFVEDTIHDNDTKVKIVVEEEHRILKTIGAATNASYLNEHNGDGQFRLSGHTQLTKDKISSTRKLRQYDRSLAQQVNAAINLNWSWKDKQFSDEHKQALRENHVGMTGKRHTDDTKRKMSAALAGREKTAEHKAALRAAKLGKPGHAQTEESKRKIRDRNKTIVLYRRAFSQLHNIPYKQVTKHTPGFLEYVKDMDANGALA